ncbi:type VII secretion target [Saccharomonospora sp. NPDC006951]
MPDGGFELGSDLAAHATQIDSCAEGIMEAVEAARQVSMPTDAYGILCQPFRMLLDPVEQSGIDALNEAVDAMTATAEKVRNASESYLGTEDVIVSTFQAGD